MEIIEDLLFLYELILRHKFLALSMAFAWSGTGLAAELLWMFFWSVLRDFYPVLPKKGALGTIWNLFLGLLGGPIVFLINTYYILSIKKIIRKDSDDNGGNFLRIAPDLPVLPLKK